MSSDIISLYRSRLAREKGTVVKDRGGKLAVALAYPNTYRLGMSNLGYQYVYHLLNRRPDVVAERVFLPESQEMALYLQSGKPLLSLESQAPVHDFDVVAFSLSFENDYLHVLKILELAKIPLLAEKRSKSCPYVMAGGVTTFMNPEPLAPFMDFFLPGEAEAVLDEFLDHFLSYGNVHRSRSDILRDLCRNMSSVYVPSFYHTEYHRDGTIRSFLPTRDHVPERIKIARSTAEQIPASGITTPDTEFGGKVLIELGRGCTRSCRFCAAGYVYRPPRIPDETTTRLAIEEALQISRNLGLIAPAISDIPGIEDLASLILDNGGRFSVSSLRADSLTPRLLDHLHRAGQRTITIAPEAGSERLRRVINKHLTRSQIADAAKRLACTHAFAVRLYFLVGLPTETRQDIREILELVKTVKHHMIRESAPRGTIGQIRLSVNCFVPKPFTPFQWVPLEQIASLKEKQKWLKKNLGREGGVRVNFDVPKWAYVQALLSMGDRRVSAMLLRAHEQNGNWTQALRFSDVNPDFFVYRPRGTDEILPWDFVDHGISKKHLLREYALAIRGEQSDICHVGECYRCGVCVPAKPDGR